MSVVAELVGTLTLARSAIEDDEARRILDGSQRALKARLKLIQAL